MDIDNYIRNNLISLRVTPNASKTELKEENGKLKLHLQAVPEKGKANAAVIKFFKKEYGLRVEIKSGEKSRDKVLRVLD